MTDPVQKSVVGAGEDGDAIDEAQEKHGDFDPQVAIEDAREEIKAQESTVEVVDGMFQIPQNLDEEVEATKSRDHGYMRNLTFATVNKDEVDPDPENAIQRAEEAKERLQEIEMVNQELKATGSHRRYVPNENEAPDTAHVYEDEFGKYYYEGIDEEQIRPSDVAKYAGVEAWPMLEGDEKVLKTIELLNEFSGEPLADADSKEAAMAWLQRHMARPETDASSQDVFDPDTLERVAKTVAAASVA